MVSVVDFLDAASDRRAARVLGFSAGTGSVTTTGSSIADFEPVDLDNDSVDDLLVVSRASSNDDTGSLVAIRGVKRQLWKRLGETGEAAGDFDNDGVLDLVRSLGDGTLIAVSGATGRQLWNSRHLPAVSTWRIFPISHRTERIDGDKGLSRDLNGDGCDDFLVATSNVSGMKRSPLAAVSGRDGRMLWSAKDCEGSMITGTSAAECRDLDGDGIKEVVWVCSINHDYPDTATIFSNQNVQLWMFATSTKDGRLLWSHALSPAYSGVSPPPMSMRFDGDNKDLPLTMVDLNRDGHLDVIAPAQTSNGLCMRAIDGKSGTTMWERERDSGLGNFGMGNSDGFHMWSAPAVVDFEGDGKSELVIWEPLRPIPNESKGNSTPQPEVAVTALDAQGRTLWTQSTGRPFSQFSPWGGYKENPNRMLALNVREPGDKKSDREQTKSREQTEYVVLFPERDGTVFVWDAKGNAAEANAIRKVDGSLPLVLDIDGDGSDELIVVDSARSDKQTSSAGAPSSWRNAFEQDQVVVKCFRPDALDHPVWISELGIGRSIGQSNNSELNPTRPQELYVRTDAYGNHEVCIRCGPIGNCVYGLKPSDGTILWKCHGPISRVQQEANSYSTLNGVCLLDDSPGLPPVVCFQHANWTDCRIAAPTESTVQQHAKAPDQESTSDDPRLASVSSLNRVSAVSRPGSSDRRLLRRLPWNPEFAQDPRIVSFLAFGTMLSCCLVLGPIFCVIWLATRRPMELKHLFLVPVVAAVFLQAWWATPPSGHEFETGWLKAMTAFFFAPPLAATMFVLWQIWFRRWPSLVRWTCVWLVSSLVISVLVLTISSHNSPMSQHENYDYSGWYWILVPGALVTAWIMLPVCGATWLIQSLNRRIRLREVAASRVS
ncbi:MAG: VCBS repeat-containing protein [Pirellulales bacterium]